MPSLLETQVNEIVSQGFARKRWNISGFFSWFLRMWIEGHGQLVALEVSPTPEDRLADQLERVVRERCYRLKTLRGYYHRCPVCKQDNQWRATYVHVAYKGLVLDRFSCEHEPVQLADGRWTSSLYTVAPCDIHELEEV